MRLMLILLLLSVSALAEEAIELPLTENTTENTIQYQWTWLSIARYQMLTNDQQDVIVVTSRDFLALSMHSMNQHRIANCVKKITEGEMRAIKNATLSVISTSNEYTHSAVARISNRLFGLCSVSRQHQDKKDSERA